MLSKLYCKGDEFGPDGEKMRFIPSPTHTQHSKVLKCFSDIIRRQAWFQEGIVRISSTDVLNIDGRADPLPRLRMMVMKMKTSHGKRMFIGIDEFWDGSTSFIFPKIFEAEARNRIADLGSYLYFHNGELGEKVLLRHFTPAAAARAIQSPWNEELQRAESKYGQDLMDFVRECDDIEWLKASAPVAPPVQLLSPFQNISAPLFHTPPNDDGSLESFSPTTAPSTSNGPSKQQTHIPILHLVTPSQPTQDVEDDLTNDEQAIVTLASRMSILESDISSMATNVNSMVGAFQLAITQLSQVHPSQAPTSREGAGVSP